MTIQTTICQDNKSIIQRFAKVEELAVNGRKCSWPWFCAILQLQLIEPFHKHKEVLHCFHRAKYYKRVKSMVSGIPRRSICVSCIVRRVLHQVGQRGWVIFSQHWVAIPGKRWLFCHKLEHFDDAYLAA